MVCFSRHWPGLVFLAGLIGHLGMMVPGASALDAPILQFPTNGESILLVNQSDSLQLRWSRVSDATGYLVNVSGPPAYGSFRGAEVEQETSNPFITYPLNQLTAGSYVWSVSAVNEAETGPSPTYTFEIRSGTVGGGDLTAPLLLFPPDYAFAQVASTRITFKWAPVAEATEYLFHLPGEFPAPIRVDGSMTELDVSFLTQGSKIHFWNVTAVNAQQTQGKTSETREFLLTRFGFTPTEIFYRLASDWFTLNSVLNVSPDPPFPQGEPITNHFEALALIPYQRGAKPSAVTGLTSPTLLSPPAGADVPLVDNNGDFLVDTRFEWQFPNPDGYEFQLLDEAQTLIVTHLIPRPTGGENPFTRISRTTGEGMYFWRVRALRNNAAEASPYSPLRSFTLRAQSN